MQKLGYLLAAFLGLVSLMWPPLMGAAQPLVGEGVENFRFGVEATRTRLVLDLNAPLQHRWFTLQNPHRVVVDFLSEEGKEIGFGKDPSRVSIPAGSRVTALRAGTFKPGVVRMVLDLSRPSKVSVFGIPARGKEGNRLVVDVMTVRDGERATVVPPPREVVTHIRDTGAWNPDWGRQGVRKPAEKSTDYGGGDVAEQQPPAPVVPKADGVVRVVLDPGHGGVDPGACGKSIRLCEKHLVLDMAKRVRDELRGKVGGRKVEVLLTRERDVFIPLGERVRIAQRWGADVFVSLHADSAPSRNATGATVYMLSDKASDREAQRLADSENAGDDLAGLDLGEQAPEVRNILIDLVQRDTMNGSAYLGQAILSQMSQRVDVRKRNVLSAGFRVLKAPEIPSVLVELGYLSNPREERLLSQPRHRAKLAAAVAEGIENFVVGHLYQ